MVWPIPIIVLASKNVSRTEAFLRAWDAAPEAPITVAPGVYLDWSEAPVDPLNTFQNIIGRALTIQELGCAKAHYLAREAIAGSEIGGIIFEDDARLQEPQKILKVAREFLEKHRGQSRILNLCESSMSSFQFNVSTHLVELWGYSPLAVAYVLTPEAARELNRANSQINWVSDWPYSKVTHFVCVPALVAHGDENSGSEIAILQGGEDLRHDRNLYKRLRIIFDSKKLYGAFRNRNISKFIYFIFVAPLLWRLDHIRLKVKNLQT
jgi:GR25 family glycosyltransferase involved in LPS biosynthesis